MLWVFFNVYHSFFNCQRNILSRYLRMCDFYRSRAGAFVEFPFIARFEIREVWKEKVWYEALRFNCISIPEFHVHLPIVVIWIETPQSVPVFSSIWRPIHWFLICSSRELLFTVCLILISGVNSWKKKQYCIQLKLHNWLVFKNNIQNVCGYYLLLRGV